MNLNSNIETRLPKQGPVANGILQIKSTKQAHEETTGAWADAYISFMDKNNVRLGFIQQKYNADGSVDLYITTPFGKVYINGTLVG